MLKYFLLSFDNILQKRDKMAAKEHSFDISAKVEIQEFKNALTQAKKEIDNRFDFKDDKAKELNFNEKDKTIFLLKEKGYIVTEIANILGYKQPFISKRLSVVYDYLKTMINIDTFTEHEMKNLVLDLYKKCKRKSENKLWVVTKDFSSIYGLEYPIAKLLANKWISEIEK